MKKTQPVLNRAASRRKGRVAGRRAALWRENRLLGAVVACQRTLVRAAAEAEVLSELCLRITQEAGYVFACVGLAELAERKPIRFVASAGCDEACVERAKITWASLKDGEGAVVRAIRTRRPVVCRDLQDAPEFNLACTEAIKRRVGSVLILPLVEGRRALGLWFLYAAQRDAFDAGAVTLLAGLAADLAHVIVALRPRQNQERASAELAARYASLTPREREVMALVASGLPNKRIAAQLGTATITVKIQRGKVMKKLQAQSVADLVRMADKLRSEPGGGSGPRKRKEAPARGAVTRGGQVSFAPAPRTESNQGMIEALTGLN